jgi:hypothetical protein
MAAEATGGVRRVVDERPNLECECVDGGCP